MNTHPPRTGALHRSRRRTALALALGMTASLTVALPAAADPPPTPSPVSTPTPAADPLTGIKQEAKKQNKRLEIVDYRTETSTTYANPDATTLYTELHSTPIRVHKDGTWQDIDPTLIEDDGTIRPKAIKGELTLSAGGNTTLVKTASDNGKAKVFTPRKLPKPALSANTATYPSAYGKGIDLVVTATPTGYHQQIVFRQRPTGKPKLRIPIDLPKGMKYGKDRAGKPALLADKTGQTITPVNRALMIDATAADKPDAGRAGAAAVSIEQTTDGQALVLTPDTSFLTDPQVTYPVTMAAASDTWTGTGLDGDTFVNNAAYPNGNENDQLNRILVGKSNSGTVTWRGYIRFNIKGTPLEGGTVENADLRLWNYRANLCQSQIEPGITVRRITTDWNMGTLRWNNQPSVTSSGQVGNKGAYSDDCSRGEGELYYSIEQIVQDWMNGYPDYGVRLYSSSEDVATNWRWYRSSQYGYWGSGQPRGPVLFVQYTPGTFEQEVVVPIAYTGPDQDEPLTYAEAMARRLKTESSDPPPPTVTLAEAQQAGEQTVDTYEVPPDDLLPLPEEEPEADDITPPVVVETTPANSAADVSTTTTVQVVLSEPVSGTTLTVKDAAGTPVPGTLESAGEDRVTVFTPTQALTPQTTYTAEVSGSRDAAGNTLAATYSWSFTTEPSATPTPTPTDPPATETISLPLLADTWLDNQGTVGPAAPTLWVGAYGDGPFKAIERTYLSFNTAAIAGKTIVNAELELWNNASYGCGGNGSGIKAQRITSAWRANTLRWSNQPSVVTEGEVTATDPGGCTGQPPSGTAWTWSLTAIAQAWAAGQANHGVMLRGVDESATAPEYDRGYQASESEEENPRPPMLKVTYVSGTGPGPTPTPTSGPDTTSPTVVSVSPADGAEGVPSNAQVKVTFSEPVTGARLSMWDLFTSEEVAGSALMSTGNTVLTFVPAISLNSWYELEVSGGTDGAGNAMEPYSWVFTNYSGSSARSEAQSAQAAASPKAPTVGHLWTRPFTTEGDRHLTSTATPDFLVKISGPLRRWSTVSLEVEHDPEARDQGTGLIWSGRRNLTSSGVAAAVRIPDGRLTDGWRVRWRARPTAMGVTGAWSDWQSLVVKLPRPEKSTLKAEQQEKVDAAAVPKTFPYDRVTWERCWTNSLAGTPRDRPNGDKGRIGHSSNPYNWCGHLKMRMPVYKVVVNRQGVPVREEYKGQVNFRFSARAYTHAGGKKGSANEEKDKSSGMHGRDILFRWRVDQIKWSGGDIRYYNAMTLRVGIAVSEKCQITAGPGISGMSGGKETSFQRWGTDAEAEWTIHSPKSLGEGRHAFSACMIVPSASYTSPLTNATPGGNFSNNFPVQWPIVRCDTSSLIHLYTGGCIFMDVNPVLVFDATVNIGIRESAKHVWDAYYHADAWTKPVIDEPKRIPGHSPYGKLHRTIEGAVPGLEDPDEAPSGTINANRRNSIRVCERTWPTVRPAAEGLDCDEYPFASTQEGSLAAHGHYSVRYITHSDNRKSGNQLGKFYQRQRRLGGDAFWVYPKPLAGDQNTPPVR